MRYIFFVLFILILISAAALCASIVVDAKTIFAPGSVWANFSVSPQSVATSDNIVFLQDGAERGGGTLFFTTSSFNGSSLFGLSIPQYPYRYNDTPPVPPRPPVKLTNGQYNSEPICPLWFSPPPPLGVTVPLIDGAENQSTTTQEFQMLTTEIGVDNANRITLHGDAVQLFARFSTPATDLAAAVANSAGDDDINAAVPKKPVTLLWGRHCNRTHFWYPPQPPRNATPPSEGEKLDSILLFYNLRSPTFLADGTLIFTMGHFPCIFSASPSSGWVVKSFVGNCSAHLDPYLPVPDFIKLNREGSLTRETDIGRIRSFFYDPVDDAVYIATGYGSIFALLLADGSSSSSSGGGGGGGGGVTLHLLAGNTSAPFNPAPLVCDDRQPCSPYATRFNSVVSMSVWREHGTKKKSAPTASSSSSSSLLPSKLSATHLFFYDAPFETVYTLSATGIVTEMTISRSHSSSHGSNSKDDPLSNCRPRSLVASDADLFVACSDRSTLLRRRLMKQDPFPPLARELPVLDRNTITSMTTLTTLLALVGVPTVALTAGRTRAIIALVRCDVTMERGAPLPWSESPLQLQVGGESSDFRYIAGAVVGNIALLIAAPMLVHWIVVKVLARMQYQKAMVAHGKKFGGDSTLAEMLLELEPPPTEERTRLDVEAKLRFPSATFSFGILFTVEPTTRCAIFLIKWAHDRTFEPEEELSFGIGIGGIVITVIGVCAVAFFYIFSFSAVFYPNEEESSSDDDEDGDDDDDKKKQQQQQKKGKKSHNNGTNSSCTACIRRWYGKWKRLSKPYGFWKDHANRQELRFGGIIKPYTQRGIRGGKFGWTSWIVLGEIVSVMILATLVGVKTRDTCSLTTILFFVVILLFFLGMIITRPQASPIDNIVLSLVAGLQVCAGIAAIVAVHHPLADPAAAGNSLAETLALAAAFVLGIDTFVDVGQRAFKLMKFFCVKCSGEEEEEDGNKNGDFTGVSAIQHDPFAAAPNSAPILVDRGTYSSDSAMGSRQGSMQTKSTKSSGASIPSPSPCSGAMFPSSANAANSTPHAGGSGGDPPLQVRVASDDFALFDNVARNVQKQQEHEENKEADKKKKEEEEALAAAFLADLEAKNKEAEQEADDYRVNDDDVFSDKAADSVQNLNSQYQLDDDNDDDDEEDTASGQQASSAGSGDLVRQAAAEERKRKRRTELMEFERLRAQLKATMDNQAGAEVEEQYGCLSSEEAAAL